jgi:hypothetical protein
MASQLETYLETGFLPGSHFLTQEQRAAVVHAPGDERVADIAERIDADFFVVQRYRAYTAGLVSTRIYWRDCAVCKQRFVTRFARRMMHEECRQRVDRRIAHREAA